MFEPFDTVTLAAVLSKLAAKLRGQGKTVYVVCIWSDLASVLKLFGMLRFQTVKVQRMLMPVLNYAIFSLEPA